MHWAGSKTVLDYNCFSTQHWTGFWLVPQLCTNSQKTMWMWLTLWKPWLLWRTTDSFKRGIALSRAEARLEHPGISVPFTRTGLIVPVKTELNSSQLFGSHWLDAESWQCRRSTWWCCDWLHLRRTVSRWWLTVKDFSHNRWGAGALNQKIRTTLVTCKGRLDWTGQCWERWVAHHGVRRTI